MTPCNEKLSQAIDEAGHEQTKDSKDASTESRSQKGVRGSNGTSQVGEDAQAGAEAGQQVDIFPA